MTQRRITPDLVGSGETLDQMLRRLRAKAPRKQRPPRDALVTSPRVPRGAGGAEAPIPVSKPLPDLCAA